MRTPSSADNARMTCPRPGVGRSALSAAAAVVSAILLTSCATHDTGRFTHAAAHGSGAGERGGVTLGINGQAWTLTAKTVSVRSGGTWQRINPPVMPAAGNSVVVRGRLVLVASVADTTLTLAVSRDGGGTWAMNRVHLRTQTTDINIALSPDAKRWVVGPASNTSVGSPSQYSDGFVNTTRGTLTEVSLPGSVANLAWSGSALLVPGGPADSHLYLSTNLAQSWQDVSRTVLGFTPPAMDIPATEPVFGPVLGLSSGTAVVTVEHVGATGLNVDLEATTTGTSYTSVGSVTATGDYATGPLTIASSSYGPDEVALVLPGSTDLYVVASQGKPITIHMSGLPVSPDSISFQDTVNGMAQTTVSSCASGKSDCTVTVSQSVTSDGGRTWTPS